MKDVASQPHIVLRKGVWTYRRRVPTHLVEKADRREVKRSLGTSDRAEAKRRANVEDLRFDKWVRDLEGGSSLFVAERKASTPWTITVDELIDHTRAYVAEENDRRAKRLLVDPPENDEERGNMLDTVFGEQQELSDPERSPLVGEIAETIADRAGISGQHPAALLGLAARALLEVAQMQGDRLAGDYTATHHDVLFSPRPADARPRTTFSTLCDQYLAELREEHRLNGIASKRTAHVAAEVMLLREIVGPETLVSTIDYEAVQKVRATLARVPIGKTVKYPGLTLAEAIARGEVEGVRPLAAPTQGAYWTTFQNILLRAVRQKILPSNPAEDVKPLVKDSVPLHEKRHPFRLDQLKGFFEGKFYRSCAADATEPYVKKDQAWRYWVPLIMLFTGARPNEVCQLFVDDIRQTAQGTWYFDMIDEVEGQSRKNSASRRRIPIHPELIKLGFLDFAAERRQGIAEHGERLFYELRAYPGDPTNFARYVGRRFNKPDGFLRQEITVEPRQAFYSIRHSVRDALRRTKASEEALLAIGGWTPAGGKAVSSNYGDIHNPDLWVSEVARIAFGDLDLSFLYPKGKD